MIEELKNRMKGINYLEEKKRFLLFALLLLLLLFLAFYLLGKAYASYQSSAKLNANIEQALYIFGGDRMSFNIDPEKIVPSDQPYTYKFSIANFNANQKSEVDLNYSIAIRSTTNLPITLELYRNENYGDEGITNLLTGTTEKQDEDGAWYRVYDPLEEYRMNYTEQKTDIYTLVVKFPKIYAENTIYADDIENIEITIKSTQVIE